MYGSPPLQLVVSAAVVAVSVVASAVVAAAVAAVTVACRIVVRWLSWRSAAGCGVRGRT